jgi:hypothetical protein
MLQLICCEKYEIKIRFKNLNKYVQIFKPDKFIIV